MSTQLIYTFRAITLESRPYYTHAREEAKQYLV